ncbi:MAG: hypothetical protein ACMUIU_11800 [bacterium]
MKRCKRCLTPDSYPRTSFNNADICNHCLDYEKTYSGWEESKKNRIKQFEHLIDLAKKRSKEYDVLIPLSGGKDSTYVLYLATKKYRLKALCYNFDNGFQSQIARDNIRSAIEVSGADLIVYKPNEKLLMKLYRHFLKHTGLFCPVCMRGIYVAQLLTARQFNIRLILKGTSRRTEENLVPEIFQDGRLSFFKNVLKKYPFDENIRSFCIDRNLKEKLCRAIYLLSHGKIILGAIDIQLPDFFDWNYKEIYQVISNEMGWKTLPDRDEHVDCLADPAVHYSRKFRCKDLTPSTLRYSAEIRSGQLDRSKALGLINEEELKGINEEYIDYFLTKLEIGFNDLEFYLIDKFRHMEFQKEGIMMSIFNKIR